MTESQEGPKRKNYGLFALAIILLLAGGATLFLGSRNFGIRSLGLVAFIASVYVIRASNVHSRSTIAGQCVDSNGRKGGGRLMWIIGAALVPAAGASFLYLYQDALHGYHELLPVYVFAGVAALCALVWSYLASRALH